MHGLENARKPSTTHLFVVNGNEIVLPSEEPEEDKLSLQERNERDMSGYYHVGPRGVEERGEIEERKALELARQQTIATWEQLEYDLDDYQSTSFSLSDYYNSHASGLVLDAENAALRATNDADNHFGAVAGQSITAPDGTVLYLNAKGQFVDKNGKEADPHQLEQMDENDPALKPFIRAQNSIALAQTEGHTLSRRQHQAAEAQSMQALAATPKEQLKAAPATLTM
jgi:peptidoglycan hydrolase-like protein with peptidoglycan-binding domain